METTEILIQMVDLHHNVVDNPSEHIGDSAYNVCVVFRMDGVPYDFRDIGTFRRRTVAESAVGMAKSKYPDSLVYQNII